MNIIPKPNNLVKYTEGEYLLKPILQVSLSGFSKHCLEVFAIRTDIKIEEAKNSDSADILLQNDLKYEKEQYTLEVTPKQIKITAASESGVIAALTSFYTVIIDGKSSCFKIEDAPRYGHRGHSLDCVRHFFEVEEVKKVIEQLALVKINVFHWHLTDDQGWRIESKVFPKLHELNGQKYYTQKEILEVIEFAKIRGIEVIPEIELPGHTTAVIAAYPHLSCQGKPLEISTNPGGIHDIILCAGKESTYDFVFALLDEACDLFESSPRFHIGGDEAPKTEWENCEDCKAQLAKINGNNMEDLQVEFTTRVVDFLKSKNKTAICWNEVLRGSSHPEDIEVQFWIEPDNEEQMLTYFNAGGKMIFSDMFYNYLDYSHSMSSLERVYNYVPKIAEQDCQDAPNTLGIESCLWGERVDTPQKLQEQIFPRVFAMAEAAWTYKKDYSDFEKRLPHYLKGLEQKGMTYTSMEKSNPSKADRIVELTALKHLLAQYLPKDTASQQSIDFFNFLTKGFQLPIDLMSPIDE